MRMTARKVLRWAVGLTACAALLAVPTQANAGQAITLAGPQIIVNSTADSPLASTSVDSGKCADSLGRCTLRAAIMLSNDLGGGATIIVPAGHYTLTIAPNPALTKGDVPDPSTGDLDVLVPTTIRGAGARKTIIDGNGLDRVITFDDFNSSSTMSDVTITGGVDREEDVPEATGGGGIWNWGNLTLERVTVTHNNAGSATDGSFGGGVFTAPSSFLTLIDSTISDNVAGMAGGVRFDTAGSVINSTITGNHAVGNSGAGSGVGGGIDLRGEMHLTISYSTIAGNSARDGGGGINAAPAYSDQYWPASTVPPPSQQISHVYLDSTIVADNPGPSECKQVLSGYVSLGNNIAGDHTCGLTQPTDHPGVNPRLGPVADNGGPTDTLALLLRSPAIDAGDDATCPSADQRGVPRPQGPHCDIGAFELYR